MAIIGILAPPQWAARLVPLAAFMQSAIFALSSKSMELGFGLLLILPIGLLFWSAILTVWAIRVLRYASIPRDTPTLAQPVPIAADFAIGAIGSAILALWVALGLHAMLEGSDKPLIVHRALGGLFIGLTLAAVWLAPLRTKGFGAGGATLCAILFWSATQPDRMLASGASIAQDAAWCIELTSPAFELEHPAQIMALSAPARRIRLIVGPAPYKTYHWSRYFQEFRPDRVRSGVSGSPPIPNTPTCLLQERFDQSLGK